MADDADATSAAGEEQDEDAYDPLALVDDIQKDRMENLISQTLGPQQRPTESHVDSLFAEMQDRAAGRSKQDERHS